MVQDRVGPESGGGVASAQAPRNDVEAIKADLAALRAEMANLVQDVVSMGKVQAGTAGERFKDAARSRLDQLGSAWEDAADQGRQVIENVQTQIEHRPLASVGIAFGAGLLLGALLKR